MKLKTLKDIWLRDEDIKLIKAEAIKWVKDIDNFNKTEQDIMWEILTGNMIKYSIEGKQTMRNFIMYFFNITEEDLK